MKLFFNTYKSQWSIHLIPNIDLYIERFSPINHGLKDGFTGVYIVFKWLVWEIMFGITKKLKK